MKEFFRRLKLVKYFGWRGLLIKILSVWDKKESAERRIFFYFFTLLC